MEDFYNKKFQSIFFLFFSPAYPKVSSGFIASNCMWISQGVMLKYQENLTTVQAANSFLFFFLIIFSIKLGEKSL